MVLRRRGRHCRPGKTRTAVAATVGTTATAGAVILTGHATPPPPPGIQPATPLPGIQLTAETAPQATRAVHTVVAGDTLWGIAEARCGNPRDYPALYAANKETIGPDPDVIKVGQRLTLDCVFHPGHPHAVAPDPPRGRYGHPYFCGDGDGDGWDRPCSIAGPPPHAIRRVAVIRHAGGVSGTYSFAGLEALWESAGGPAWAASAAAAVAECESGGRVNAFNPSGASGLFQILGQVVPGNIFDPVVNAENAVAKFKASGDTWAQWVCRP